MNPHSTPENEGAASSEPQPGQDLWARGASGAQTHAKPAAPAWERDVLERLVFATVSEQRSARRWRISSISLSWRECCLSWALGSFLRRCR